MITYNDLILKIKNIITSNVPEIKSSYDYAPEEIAAFPAIIVIPQGHENNFHTLGFNGQNVRNYNFSIRIIGNLENTEINTQKSIRSLTDKIADVLEKNPTLDNTVDWSYPTKARFGFEGQPARYYYAEITLQARFRFFRAN
jgi:hypothetical protein